MLWQAGRQAGRQAQERETEDVARKRGPGPPRSSPPRTTSRSPNLIARPIAGAVPMNARIWFTSFEEAALG